MSGKCLWWYHVRRGRLAIFSSALRAPKPRLWHIGVSIKGKRWARKYTVGLYVYVGRISISLSLWIPWWERKEVP